MLKPQEIRRRRYCMFLAQSLKELEAEKKLDYLDVARLTDRSVKTVLDYERGSRRITHMRVPELLEFFYNLGKEIHFIFTDVAKPSDESQAKQQEETREREFIKSLLAKYFA